ncbi:ABC transporter permease [Arvimicrobium flavum]|uniref:ABC transporter permease n=1 Tax=Arvimicrobium flavum TaxID=3393320 RepID=UPI00237C0171|nr:ABC transporter permease [Mesorhizobium shangrilense]
MIRIVNALLLRVFNALPVLIGVVTLTFFLLQLAPGDIVDVYAAETNLADPGELERLRREYGLYQPIWLQYLSYLAGSLTFDFGFSLREGAPVIEMILDRLPATLLLNFLALTFAFIVGVTLGTLAALRVGTWADAALSVLMIVFFAAPSFWVGLMFIVVFSVNFGWLPVSGMVTVGAEYGMLGYLCDVALHLILPTLALGLFYASMFARVMRASVLEVHGMDFVQTAEAKGLRGGRIVLKHILPNAILPVVTLLGLNVGTALAGSVVIESVFSWPGIGSMLFSAVQARDIPIVTGILFLSTFLVIVANILVDLFYVWIDPRIEV